jgi:hypothetical protein
MILASPLSDANGYLVISNLFTYARTWVGGDLCYTCCLCQNLLISFIVFLGLGLLAAPWLKSFRSDGRQWRPRGSRLGLKTIDPLTLLFVLVNLLVVILSWWPANLQKSLHTESPILPTIAGPIVGTVFLFTGAVYWFWDLHVLRWIGYTWKVEETEPDGGKVEMIFTVGTTASESLDMLTDVAQP